MARHKINYASLGIETLLDMADQDREYATKVLKKQKRYKKTVEKLTSAQKMTKATTKAPGLFRRLFGSGKKVEVEEAE